MPTFFFISTYGHRRSIEKGANFQKLAWRPTKLGKKLSGAKFNIFTKLGLVSRFVLPPKFLQYQNTGSHSIGGLDYKLNFDSLGRQLIGSRFFDKKIPFGCFWLFEILFYNFYVYGHRVRHRPGANFQKLARRPIYFGKQLMGGWGVKI